MCVWLVVRVSGAADLLPNAFLRIMLPHLRETREEEEKKISSYARRRCCMHLRVRICWREPAAAAANPTEIGNCHL